MTTVTLNGRYAELKERVCDICGCKFTFEPEDIKWVAHNAGAVTCPQCKEILLCVVDNEYHKCSSAMEKVNLL